MNKKNARVAMLGCFDSKGPDYEFLYRQLVQMGLEVVSINLGVRDTHVTFYIDHPAQTVAQLGGTSLAELRSKSDRNLAIDTMGQGAAIKLGQLLATNSIVGAIGMGGGGGTHMILCAMQALPFGMPKICLSTLAAKDLSDKMQSKDIVLIPSLVDVAGINRISATLISQSAGALCGMLQANRLSTDSGKGTIAISVFGNTTACANACSDMLKEKGYDVLPFHAVGTGGKTMEALIREGLIDGVLDLTTTELADNLCGGICSAGPDRLTAAGEVGIPQVVAPGCLDMVNFGSKESVPAQYKSRQLHSWAPDVTLMRTTIEENKILGQEIAKKVNLSKGKSAVLLPLGGISLVSERGEVFHDPAADSALFSTIQQNLRSDIPCKEMNLAINDEAFAAEAVDLLIGMLEVG